MSGWTVGGVKIDPYGKGKETAGHVVGQVLGGEARQQAEAGLDVYSDAMYNPESWGEGLEGLKKKMGIGPPTLEEGNLGQPDFSGGGTGPGGENQAELIAMLKDRAAGTGGPSAAQDQLQLASDQNMRGALAMAASGRGNPALAMQAAGQQRGVMGQQLVAQSGALRAQEQQQATSQLGSAIRGDQQEALGYAGLEAQMYNAEQARIAQVNAARLGASAQKEAGYLGAVGSGLGAFAALSDERVKKDKAPVSDSDVDEFYAALKPKSYKYKDPHAAGQSSGEKMGMMAQDVEGTELGDKLFSRRADGISQYDPQVLDGILLAGVKKLMKDQKHGDS